MKTQCNDIIHFKQSRGNIKIKKRTDEVREKREERGDPLFGKKTNKP